MNAHTERIHTVPVVLLQLFAVTAFAIPSNYVVPAIGAAGYVASLIGLVCFALWGVTAFLGYHNPIRDRTPISAILGLFWVSVLVSYARIVSIGTDEVRQLAADRELLLVAAISGVVFTATEALDSKRKVFAVVEVMCWSVAFCAIVGAMQYWLRYDLSPVLGGLPGFELNSEAAPFSARYGMVRVAGTALSPIEFGVACGMMLPIAIARYLVRTDMSTFLRWTPMILTALGSVLSVSRSGVLAVAVSLAFLVFMLPERERRQAYLLLPLGLVMVFALVPGFLTTMSTYITGARSDPSITTRTDDYTYVFDRLQEQPWIGHGAGWFQFRDALQILDNQYLVSAINFGILGVVALLVLFIGSAVTALVARARSTDPDLRLLCAALASALVSGAACSAAFDSLSFPIFSMLLALLIGLTGACWLLARRDVTQDLREPVSA